MEVRAKKALGQHFLTDLSIAQRIADSLLVPCPSGLADGITPMPTLEVGPGMGVLTQYLLQRPEVDLRMVEIDTESVDYLLVHFPQVNGRLIEADFLKLKLETFFSDKFCVIGNFPYNISSQIFFKILDYKEQIPQVVCMIQKEVADRICAKAGTRDYGAFTVFIQYYARPELLFTVDKECFIPQPKVQSAVVRLNILQSPAVSPKSEELFFRVVKASFAQRRKQLVNSLYSAFKSELEKESIIEILSSLGHKPTIRGEELTIEDFCALSDVIYSKVQNIKF